MMGNPLGSEVQVNIGDNPNPYVLQRNNETLERLFWGKCKLFFVCLSYNCYFFCPLTDKTSENI